MLNLALNFYENRLHSVIQMSHSKILHCIVCGRYIHQNTLRHHKDHFHFPTTYSEKWQRYVIFVIPNNIDVIPNINVKPNNIGQFDEAYREFRVRRVGLFNFGSGRVRVLKKYLGSGRVGLGIGYFYQILSQSGIIGYWNLDRVFAEYLPYFLYFLISIILFD